MKLEFGIGLGGNPRFMQREDTRKFMELVDMVDSFGIRSIGTPDTSFVHGDAFARVTMMALAAKNARVGLQPTNSLTREPQVMASFLASIDTITGGHAFMNIASGDSSVFNIGYKPASRARIEDYVTCIRELFATGKSTFQGRNQAVQWNELAPKGFVPLTICAEGPKMLNLAGRVGDGVVSGAGVTAEAIAYTKERVAAGAREAGRDPSDVEVWFVTRTAFNNDDPAKAVEQVKSSVASILNHSMRSGIADKLLPPELEETVQKYVDGYALHHHSVGTAQNSNAHRMEELGLTQFALDRWAIAGGVDDWIKRLTQLAEAGAEWLWCSFGNGDLDTQKRNLQLFGEKVVPHFTS